MIFFKNQRKMKFKKNKMVVEGRCHKFLQNRSKHFLRISDFGLSQTLSLDEREVVKREKKTLFIHSPSKSTHSHTHSLSYTYTHTHTLFLSFLSYVHVSIDIHGGFVLRIIWARIEKITNGKSNLSTYNF